MVYSGKVAYEIGRGIGCHEQQTGCAAGPVKSHRSGQLAKIYSPRHTSQSGPTPAQRPRTPIVRQPTGAEMTDAPTHSIPNAGPELIIMQRIMQWLGRNSAAMQTAPSLVQEVVECEEGWQSRGSLLMWCEAGTGFRIRIAYSVSVAPSIFGCISI